jgi:hypothetical protein
VPCPCVVAGATQQLKILAERVLTDPSATSNTLKRYPKPELVGGEKRKPFTTGHRGNFHEIRSAPECAVRTAISAEISSGQIKTHVYVKEEQNAS